MKVSLLFVLLLAATMAGTTAAAGSADAANDGDRRMRRAKSSGKTSKGRKGRKKKKNKDKEKDNDKDKDEGGRDGNLFKSGNDNGNTIVGASFGILAACTTEQLTRETRMMLTTSACSASAGDPILEGGPFNPSCCSCFSEAKPPEDTFGSSHRCLSKFLDRCTGISWLPDCSTYQACRTFEGANRCVPKNWDTIVSTQVCLHSNEDYVAAMYSYGGADGWGTASFEFMNKGWCSWDRSVPSALGGCTDDQWNACENSDDGVGCVKFDGSVVNCKTGELLQRR